MAVLGSNISIDLHLTSDLELDTIRGFVRDQGRLDPALARALRGTIETTARDLLPKAALADCTLTVDLRLVNERVPGAPRQRLTARLDLEGERAALGAVDAALAAPERARLANAVEDALRDHLKSKERGDGVRPTVIVTPVEFR